MAYIKEDNGSWYFVVANGKDPITFKPRQIKKRGFKSKEEAELAAMEIELQIKKGEFFKGENMKFQALYDEWIETYPYTRKQSSTRNRIQSAKHLLKAWRNVPISNISKQTYRKYMNSLVPNYKYNTREGIHVVGKMIFDYAVDMEYLKVNPTENYAIPKEVDYPDNESKLVFLEKGELANFIDIAKIHGLDGDLEFFTLLAYSGMRIGEAICLKWNDLNFDKNSITINKTYYNPNNNKYAYMLQRPKTRSSKREILIDQSVMDLLKNLKSKQEKIIKKNNRVYEDQNFIFTCTEGYPRTIRLVSNRLQRLIKHMGDLDKNITTHSFRHTHASLLIEADVNMKIISHRLGHATVSTTDEIYGHLTKGLEKKGSQQFSKLMKDLVDFNKINPSDHLENDGYHDQDNDH